MAHITINPSTMCTTAGDMIKGQFKQLQCSKITFILRCRRGKLEQKMWMRAEN